MDETPQFNNPKPQSHKRHTSITTIADNVNSDDNASTSSKGSNSTTSSVVSIHVRPKTPDSPLPGSETVILDNNSNEIPKKPENRTYPKEVPQSKVHYYKPHAPVDSKPRPLTHSYKYFSDPPPKYREYKYRDYQAKNTDIPKYKDYKYKEYNKYREYKLTPWNTFWLGGYKENVPKPVPKKPKPVGRPRKPPRKIGILSAHSLFYPYSEFKYRPYEKVKEYKYRDYSGYKEYTSYREYKGRQVPLSTHYDFIGIWRPLGSKGPIPWRKSKTFDPSSRTVFPPEDGEKYFDPPVRYISQPSTTVYDPPQMAIQPQVDTLSETPVITEDVKVYDPPERCVVVTAPEEPVYTEETKVFQPPEKIFVLPVATVEVVPVEMTPVVTQQVTEPPIEYDEEFKTYDPPQRYVVPQREYKEESKDYDPPAGQFKAPREYVHETKDYDPQQNDIIPRREYNEESRNHDPPSRTITPPKEYIEEEKTTEVQEKQLRPQTAAREPTVEEIVPDVVQQHVFAQPVTDPPEAILNYEPEEKLLNFEERKILPPRNENKGLPLYQEETKIFDPKENFMSSEEKSAVPRYTEEEKTLELLDGQGKPPDEKNIEITTHDFGQGVVPITSKKEPQENPGQLEEYSEETRVLSPEGKNMTEPTIADEAPLSVQVTEKEDIQPIKEEYPLKESTETYVAENRGFSPKAAQKTPPPVTRTSSQKAEIASQMPTRDSEPVVQSEPAVAASGNEMFSEKYTENSRAFSPASAQRDSPQTIPAPVQQAQIVPEDREPGVKGEPTAADAYIGEVSRENYTEESRVVSLASAHKSTPEATPKPVIRAEIAPQQPVEESVPRVTGEPAAAASGYPPQPPGRTRSPQAVKEAWQPHPQDSSAARTPSVAGTLSKEDNERPTSEPASESSVINRGRPDTSEHSPIATLKSPTSPAPATPAERPVSEPMPLVQSSSIHKTETPMLPQKPVHPAEETLPSSAKSKRPISTPMPVAQSSPEHTADTAAPPQKDSPLPPAEGKPPSPGKPESRGKENHPASPPVPVAHTAQTVPVARGIPTNTTDTAVPPQKFDSPLPSAEGKPPSPAKPESRGNEYHAASPPVPVALTTQPVPVARGIPTNTTDTVVPPQKPDSPVPPAEGRSPSPAKPESRGNEYRPATSPVPVAQTAQPVPVARDIPTNTTDTVLSPHKLDSPVPSAEGKPPFSAKPESRGNEYLMATPRVPVEPISIAQSSSTLAADTALDQQKDSPVPAVMEKPKSPVKPESISNNYPPKSATPSSGVGINVAVRPEIPKTPQSPSGLNSEGSRPAEVEEGDIEKTGDAKKPASPVPSVHSKTTPVSNSSHPTDIGVSPQTEQDPSPDESLNQQPLIAATVPSKQKDTTQAGKPTTQVFPKQNTGDPKAVPSPRDTKRPALQPLKPSSPVASVEKPVAAASSGFPAQRPDSPYKQVSPRVQVLEEREGKPVMSLGGNEESSHKNNNSLKVGPQGGPGASLGSIQRTMRLLGK